MATELLDDGASVDARDRFGARPLSHTARFGHLQMIDLLLAHGAPIAALQARLLGYPGASNGQGNLASDPAERCHRAPTVRPPPIDEAGFS